MLPQGVKVLHSIMLNLQKFSVTDHGTKKRNDLENKNYMLNVQDTLDASKHFVPMEWERGLNQSGLVSLMYIPHFS